MNDLIARFTSRKFLLALGGAFTAFEIAAADDLIKASEIALILAPLVAFILIEGAADVLTRSTNIPQIEETDEVQ